MLKSMIKHGISYTVLQTVVNRKLGKIVIAVWWAIFLFLLLVLLLFLFFHLKVLLLGKVAEENLKQ